MSMTSNESGFSEEEEEPQSTKFLLQLHNQYDEMLKDGELARQRLKQFKELAGDIESWISNLPTRPDEIPNPEFASQDEIKILPISIPIRQYINQESTLI